MQAPLSLLVLFSILMFNSISISSGGCCSARESLRRCLSWKGDPGPGREPGSAPAPARQQLWLPASASCLCSPANSASAPSCSTGWLLPGTWLVHPFLLTGGIFHLSLSLSPPLSALSLSRSGCNSYVPSRSSEVAGAARRMGTGQDRGRAPGKETKRVDSCPGVCLAKWLWQQQPGVQWCISPCSTRQPRASGGRIDHSKGADPVSAAIPCRAYQSNQ